ncbi:PqqD family protein [Microbacterium candidum]|uniref:PqqD family protein n=1 Tax=Microbacterium candidum TaxID=3041922 RepID=A0ABT7MUY5_9MICO|nr:PqqD family protein [Microbacterium sp. ASV49]MDL9978264.1 PqqD family protein [Microbacterium sp. ASV49]
MTGYEVAPRVAVVERGDDLFVTRLPDGPIVRLDGTAAVVWREALSDSEGDIVDRVALRVGARSSDIAMDVGAFLSTLVGRHLLEPPPGG